MAGRPRAGCQRSSIPCIAVLHVQHTPPVLLLLPPKLTMLSSVSKKDMNK